MPYSTYRCRVVFRRLRAGGLRAERQRQCLRHEGGGNARQRQCLTAVSSSPTESRPIVERTTSALVRSAAAAAGIAGEVLLPPDPKHTRHRAAPHAHTHCCCDNPSDKLSASSVRAVRLRHLDLLATVTLRRGRLRPPRVRGPRAPRRGKYAGSGWGADVGLVQVVKKKIGRS